MNVPRKNRKRIDVVYVPLILGAVLWSCSPTITIVDGSGSGTSTTSIVGTVFAKDGKPVNGARVSVMKKGNLSSLSLKKQASADTVCTDSLGRFSIDILRNAVYVAIAEKGDSKCLRDSIVIDSLSVDIGELLLAPVGSVVGRVVLSAGHDPRTVLILVPGINVFFVPNQSDGTFFIGNMAPGNYDVCFRSNIGGYDSIDTVLTIRSGQCDTLDNILRLTYTGIQKVANANALWDSLLLYGVVRWSPVDTTQVPIKGYNLYRSSARQSLTLIASAITDTFYSMESLYVSPDSFLYFRINAVLATGDEGAAGLCTMNVAGRAWKETATILWPGFSNDYYVRFLEAGFGRLFMVNQHTLGILNVKDLYGEHTAAMHRTEFTNIKGIAISSAGFYVANLAMNAPADSGDMELYAFDTVGNGLGKQFAIRMSGLDYGMSKGVKALNNGNFYFLSNLRIDRRNAAGAPIDSLNLPIARNPLDIVFASISDRLLYFHQAKSSTKWLLEVISPDCVVEQSFSMPEAPMNNFVANRANNTFFSIERRSIVAGRTTNYFLSERTVNGELLSRIMVTDGEDLGAMFCCDEHGALYVRDAIEGVIKKYER